MALTVTRSAHGVCPCTASGLAARLSSLPATGSGIGSGGFAHLTEARALTQQASPPARGEQPKESRAGSTLLASPARAREAGCGQRPAARRSLLAWPSASRGPPRDTRQ